MKYDVCVMLFYLTQDDDCLATHHSQGAIEGTPKAFAPEALGIIGRCALEDTEILIVRKPYVKSTFGAPPHLAFKEFKIGNRNTESCLCLAETPTIVSLLHLGLTLYWAPWAKRDISCFCVSADKTVNLSSRHSGIFWLTFQGN